MRRLSLLFLLLIAGLTAGAQTGHADTQKTVSISGEEYLDQCLNKANDYNQEGDSQAFFYAREGFVTAMALHHYDQAVQCLYYLGVAQLNQNMLDTAALTFSEGLKGAILIRNKKLQIDFNNALGACYSYLDDFPNALKAFNNAQQLLYGGGDLKRYADILHNIAATYTMLKDTLQAISYLEQCDSLYTALKDKRGSSNNLLMLSQMYCAASRYDEATATAERLLKMAGTMKSPETESDAWYALGNSLARPGGDYNKAIACYNKSLQLDKQINGGAMQQGDVVFSLGTAYGSIGKYQQALDYDIKALTIFRQQDDKYGEAQAWEQISEDSRAIGDFKTADSAQRLSRSLNDSLNTVDEQIAVVREDESFKYQKKHLSDSMSNAISNEGLNTQMSQQKKTGLIVLAGLVLLAILVMVLLRMRQKKSKARLSSDFQKKVSELEQQALRAQMNPHFIFNSLNTIDSYVLQNRQEDASKLVNRFSKLTRRILEQTKESYISMEQELDTLRIYLQIEQIRKNNTFDFTIEAEPQLLNFAIPPMLLQPFVENAVLHGMMESSTRQGHIKVEITEADAMIKIIIEDNGIGRHKAMELKMARPESHGSISMELTQNRLISLHGHKRHEEFIRFTDFYGEATGTRVEIFLPKKKLDHVESSTD